MKQMKKRLLSGLVILLCLSFTLFLYPQSDESIDDVIKNAEEKPAVISEDQPLGSKEDETNLEDNLSDDDSITEDNSEKTGELTPLPPLSIEKETDNKSKFLILKDVKIYRDQPAERLSHDNINTYLSFIRNGGLTNQIEKIDHLPVISNGSELLKHITYKHFYRAIKEVYELSFYGKKDKLVVPPLFITHKKVRFSNEVINKLIEGNEETRKRVITSALGGLLNPDPRVRLLSTNILRRLIPEPSTWEFVNDRIKEQTELGIKKDPNIDIDASSFETVKAFFYFYETIDTLTAEQIIYNELLKLRRYISRFILVEQIKKGDTKALRELPIEVFYLVDRPIENEAYCRIPMNYFKSPMEVEVIKAGLLNKNEYVQNRCAESLIRLIRTRGIEYNIRKEIFTAILRSHLRKKVAVGWSDEEIGKLTDEEIENLMQKYLRKVKYVNPCPEDADDLYDSSNNPTGYAMSEAYKDNPIVKGEKTDKEGLKVKDSRIEALEKSYIFEN
ncbi:MAG: hypothetical protein OEV44_04165 [Spirochaetota bacterium]|nr:hypothetical protein [Spirochaetota bacterium]